MAPQELQIRFWATQAEWEGYRDVISNLYQTKRLKDVKGHMERVYNFHAT